MGTLDDLKASYGDGVLGSGPGERRSPHNWAGLCVCGHLDRYHGPTVGGLYPVIPTKTVPLRGVDYTQTQVLDGCIGALPSRGWEESSTAVDDEARVTTITVHPTCPCTEVRAVVNVDRPNRYFNQRMPADPGDHTRHPFIVGIKAFSTHLSRRKGADPDRGGSPEWVTAEFERRFTWIEAKRICSISKCTTTGDGVWPCFVNLGDREAAPHSELRCGAHRP